VSCVVMVVGVYAPPTRMLLRGTWTGKGYVSLPVWCRVVYRGD
jgi:hypothetical protein